MGRQLKAVALAALVYAALTILVPLAVQWAARATTGSVLIGVSAYFLPYVIFLVSVLIGSVWVARRSRERDIVLPALAWWIGWTLGNLVYWILVLQIHDLAAMTGVISAATFGLLTPVENALAPITLFTAGDAAFGLGFPWTLVIIYTAVFWNRGHLRRTTPVTLDTDGNSAHLR